MLGSAIGVSQHPDQQRPECPILLPVDQRLEPLLAPRLLGAPDLRSARHTLGTVEVHVRTPLIFPDDREALAELLRGLGYEPSTEEVPRFSLDDARDPRLTPREEEVLRLMAEGYTYWEIGDMLYVATGTVRMHGKRILEKLQLRRRSELARWYMPEAGRAFVLWLAGTVGAAAAQELAQAVAGWLGDHQTRIRRGGAVRVVYGPDDKALAEVPIEADDADE
jgi:DNA-binding CsgD family transcriptional regulator